MKLIYRDISYPSGMIRLIFPDFFRLCFFLILSPEQPIPQHLPDILPGDLPVRVCHQSEINIRNTISISRIVFISDNYSDIRDLYYIVTPLGSCLNSPVPVSLTLNTQTLSCPEIKKQTQAEGTIPTDLSDHRSCHRIIYCKVPSRGAEAKHIHQNSSSAFRIRGIGCVPASSRIRDLKSADGSPGESRLTMQSADRLTQTI